MSTKHENTKLGLVPRAFALALSLVLTGVVAFGFASATDRMPTRHGTVTIEALAD
jgi:hypothetical protein